jgi:hypothetical protein
VSKKSFSPLIFFSLICGVVIMNCDNGNGPSGVTKTLEIVAPKGGEGYKVGQTVTVKWKINDATKISSVGIKLSLDNGKSYEMLVDHSIPPETTSVSWTVTGDQVSNQCIVKVHEYIDESIFDKSGIFTVTN